MRPIFGVFRVDMIRFIDQTFEEKEKEINGLEEVIEKDPGLVYNRFFFMAKNGAISHLLKEMEHYFQDRGLVARAEWCEDMRSAHINVVFFDKKKAEHHRTIFIQRTKTDAPECISPCMYALDSVKCTNYYRSVPKIAVTISEVMGSEEFEGIARRLINGANFPFGYVSQSSC